MMLGSQKQRAVVQELAVAALVLAASGGCVGDGESAELGQATSTASATTYDSALAARLGADEFGMRPYILMFLNTGPLHGRLDSAEAAEIQRGHQANILRLVDEGRLVAVGPFMDRDENDSPLRGFFILNVSSPDEARGLVEPDPAIQRGWLTAEMRPWYGSAALQEVPDIHRRIRLRNP